MANYPKTYKQTWELREKNLPFDSYKDFLNSDYWKRVKKKAQSRINYQRCEFCGIMEGLELHHKHYDFIGDKHELSAIIAVCRKHHQFIHDYAKENKVSVFRATNIAYKLFESWRKVPKSMDEYKNIMSKRNGTDKSFNKYLLRESKPSNKAHIWSESDEDTYCKMWSTGGLDQDLDWEIRDNTQRSVCKVCIRHTD